ncbi:hypothetical protein ACT3TS_19230 [Specibacter sp. AOP5-B1-6]|uniref:hypothetical protein n=1 Tax=Specibacter sp. AOP5-B1-6 TaxID=3457653 RepID=UPI00402B61C4
MLVDHPITPPKKIGPSRTGRKESTIQPLHFVETGQPDPIANIHLADQTIANKLTPEPLLLKPTS